MMIVIMTIISNVKHPYILNFYASLFDPPFTRPAFFSAPPPFTLTGQTFSCISICPVSAPDNNLLQNEHEYCR